MSKELKALEQLKYYNTLANDDFDMTEELSIIETALKDYEELQNDYCKVVEERGKWQKETQKKLKALEIAKKVFKCNSLYEHHIDSAYESGWITKEEFDLLKEVLK